MWLPLMGNQVDQLILGCILDATEHVTQILVWVDVVGLAVCKDCQCPGKTGTALGTTDEESPHNAHRGRPHLQDPDHLP